MKKLMKTAIAAAVTSMLVSPLTVAAPVPVASILKVDAVIKPLELTVNVTPLNFGAVWAPGAGSTVVINPANGDRTVNGDLVADTSSAGGHGVFALSAGVPNGTATYSFAADTVTLNHADGAATGTMTAGTFLLHGVTGTLTGNVAGGGTVLLDGNGAAAFNIGGTLTVGNSQAAGTYQGEVVVTFNY